MSQRMTVSGMSCDGCEVSVEESLTAVSGVTGVEVDRTTETAIIEGSATVDELVAAIEEAGYEATDAET
ncbi:heavy-metal-associated domain-containing protein [Salinadaptatus halalkaliphilus]|uniref:Heavy-metal-associated domain-containing protein n=1 Tax=Salinadaptatus halalkaliphilus TaxID=2419781 RepID=A0A4S3TN70_9EURY|nr:heavy metal-associated domain-containing protein [Salinadaptatus halalkaliphilus]THE63998.1 heavy-metal-associated domain-containing protein [Salinadaptatus halalkaliphilus]